VCELTATNATGQLRIVWIADSSHGVGGVCSVVTSGLGRDAAIAIGR
jgi:hypothetical protein